MMKIKKLVTMLGMAGINGSVSIAATQDLFTLQNAPMIAILFMAGPGAVLTAILMEGDVKDRMIAALIAGLIATIIVVFAAGIGPKFLSFVNMKVLKMFGGLAILMIGFLIMGVKIPDKVPMVTMVVGFIVGFVMR